MTENPLDISEISSVAQVTSAASSLCISSADVPVPLCYEQSSLRESLVSAQVDNMLEFLSKKKDLRLKNQQRGEPDLTSEQQLDILKSMFESNPFSFLQRFGTQLEPVHFECFSSLKGDIDPEKKSIMKLQLKALENVSKAANKSMLIKNRRYEALQKLVDTTDYFTEEEMQRRNPILFEQLIGKYHTKEEREAFLQLSQKSSSSSTRTPLSDMLIAHMTRLDGNVGERRMEQETQIDQENTADEEYFDDEAMDEDDNDIPYQESSSSQEKKSTYINDDDEREEIDDDEKDILKEEFFTTMYRSFLEGKDEDIDYSAVDNNEEYDCGEILNQDAEDKYFDEEESQMYVCNSDVDDKSSEHGDGEIGECSEKSLINPRGTHNDVEEEDELDLYMKSIEKQLQTH